MQQDTTRHYLKNSELVAEIVACQERGRAAGIIPQVSEKLGRMLLLLVDRIGKRGCWRGYSYLSEMKGTAMVMLLHVPQSRGADGDKTTPAVLRFDVNRTTNAFAFSQTIIENAFRRFWSAEKRMATIRDDVMQDAGMAASFGRQAENDLSFAPTPDPVKHILVGAPREPLPIRRASRPMIHADNPAKRAAHFAEQKRRSMERLKEHKKKLKDSMDRTIEPRHPNTED